MEDFTNLARVLWAVGGIVASALVPLGTSDAEPVTRPASGPTTRRVEITLFGKIQDIKGMTWSVDRSSTLAWSSSVFERCNVAITLPSGKTILVDTRPILTISPAHIVEDSSDLVVSVYAPPFGDKGTLREKVAEVEKLMKVWNAKPTKRLRDTLAEMKGYPVPVGEQHSLASSVNVGGAELDEKSQVIFTFDRSAKNEWTILSIIEVLIDPRHPERRVEPSK